MDKRAALTNVIKKSSPYTNLVINPDFIQFKAEVVDRRVESYLTAAKAANLETEEGRRLALLNLGRYQDLKYMFEDIFKYAESAEVKAREQLRNLTSPN